MCKHLFNTPNQFTQPIIQVANIANVIQSAIASAERVFELLDEEEQVPETTKPVALPNPKGAVVFDHVKFGYSPDNVLMEDMNIYADPGQTIAIVGPTGAGKTTLVNLLMRFYEVNAGRILIDGVDITDLSRGDLRKLFGMVLQDTWLFHGTMRENIAYGSKETPLNRKSWRLQSRPCRSFYPHPAGWLWHDSQWRSLEYFSGTKTATDDRAPFWQIQNSHLGRSHQ